jgi:hypothetical protein
MAGRGEPLMNGCNNYRSLQKGMDSSVHELDGSSDKNFHRCES